MNIFSVSSIRSLWWLICLSIAFIGYLIAGLPQWASAILTISVSETLQLDKIDTIKFHVAELLLAWQLISSRLFLTIIVFFIGMAVSWYFYQYKKRPAFPWQAENTRAWIQRLAWGCFILGFIVSLLPMFEVLGIFAHTLLVLLWITEQWPILFALVMVPFFAGAGMVIAFIAGLYLPTHVGVRWTVPDFPLPKDLFFLIGQFAYKTTKRLALDSIGMDGLLGSIGSVLNTLKEGDRS